MVAALWLGLGLRAAASDAAYVRDKDKLQALELLTELRTQFPGNTLFPREIARLQPSVTAQH